MGIGVQGYGYGGVAEHLGDYLRVYVPTEEQRGARMAQIVEADLGKTGFLQERLEAMLGDVAPIQELPDL